jgi:Domain of unknown function (DUF4389)
VTEHAVQLIVEDDLRRSRLTVFFRLLLAIPHLIWAFLWSIAVFFAAIANWIVTLIAGRPAGSLHRFLSSYVRYLAHLSAYLWLVANPYPGFVGEEGEYPIEIRLPPPQEQSRWKTLLRIVLALPAIVLAAALGSPGSIASGGSGGRNQSYSYNASGLGSAVAVLGWFASVVRGRMPKGLRDAGAYSVGYNAQTLAYVLLLTDRYPDADPTAMLGGVERPPLHPVHLLGDAHDLRRSRVTVFFRLLLALPHLVWLALWSVAAIVVAILNWFVTLFTGTPTRPFHGFLSRYVRYALHVAAFLYLAANPFPGFTGEAGIYPLDLEIPERGRQNRWRTGFRVVLAVPAVIVNSALGSSLLIAAVFTWFVALVRGSAPWGLRNLSAYALRYSAQLYAYVFLLTDAYPHASPLEGASPEQMAFDETG